MQNGKLFGTMWKKLLHQVSAKSVVGLLGRQTPNEILEAAAPLDEALDVWMKYAFLVGEMEVIMGRPDVPKRLAARIRGAQARVMDLRDTLVHCHKRRLQAQAELDVFHNDPEAYAADRYGHHGVDSYPVKTRTGRLAEEVQYRSRRIPELEKEIPQAEAELASVEAAVLKEVLAMRPSNGRIPWPERLPSFEGCIEQGLREQQRDIDGEPARVAAHRARIQEDYERETAENERQNQLEEDAERRRFASLPPAQQEAERAQKRMFRKVMEEHGLTTEDLVEGLGFNKAFYEIEREVGKRIARGERA